MSELKHVYLLSDIMAKAWFEARPAAVRIAIMNARVVAEMARITAEAAARPAPAAYVPMPRHLRALTRPAFTRPRLVADAYAVRETARFAAEADARALGLAA